MPENEDGVDLIKIAVGDTYRVKADGAKLHMQVRGSSLMSAKMAYTKAKEVAALVGQLQTAGLPSEDIEIEGVHVEVASGSIIKTSEASYTLCATCANLDLLPSVLGVISTQKQATLQRIEWVYTDEEAHCDEGFDALIEKAKARALRLAEALGVRIISMHRFEEGSNQARGVAYVDLSATQSMAPKRSATVDLGIDINHSKEINLKVEVQYRVSSIQ